MTGSLSIRTFRASDTRHIIEFLKRNIEEWSWEYGNNPFGQLVGIAEDNGRIVGHMALVPAFFKVAEKTLLGSQAVDLIVDPEFRGRGIFLSIGKFLTDETLKKGINFWYGFPNELAHSGHLKYGWFDICDVPLLVKPVNLDKIPQVFVAKYARIKFIAHNRIAKTVISLAPKFALASIELFQRVYTRIKIEPSKDHLEICSVKSADDRFDDLWRNISKDYPVLVVRNKKYLNWRYFERPNANYELLVATTNDRILGYVVLRSKKEDELKLGYIVDIFASPDDKDTIASLILKAVEHFKEENVDLIYCWMLKDGRCTSLYYNVLKHYGFIHLFGRSHPLIARINLQQSIPNLVRFYKNWFVTIGDSDHV